MYRIFILFACVFLCLAALAGCAKKPMRDAGVPPTEGSSPAAALTEQPALASAGTITASPTEGTETATVTLVAEDGTQLEHVFFDYDAHTLSASARETLARNARWLQNHPGVQVTVEGHCDECGSDEYNLALGERRAGAVKKYLVTLGIANDRLNTISYGEERPADPGHNETAWAQNRRVEFK